jgi:NAD(P)-dependent dehydrogenase (short-subunit alcohol dehydrogenase family)
MSRGLLLVGQTLLVIGGSSGIGLETARRARAEGAEVIVTARDPERVHRAGVELGGSIAAFDATDFHRLRRFFEELPTPIDHVFVTGPGPHHVRLADLDVDEARRELEAHLLLPLQVAHQASHRMRRGGTMLFTGCTAPGPMADERTFISTLTTTLSAMTKNLADELAPIRVNLIAFAYIDPPLSAAPFGDQLEARQVEPRSTLPIRRLLPSSDIASLAVHLMTNMAITGATIDIDGVERLVES